jgi:hypothetical protein
MSREHYRTQPLTANAVYRVGGAHIAGFLPTVSGTLTITDMDGTVLVDTLPVTAGTWVRIPLLFETSAGGTVTLGGGAAGTLFL